MLTTPDLQRHIGKFYGKYSGEVTNVEDSLKVGRIQVTVPSIFPADMKVWARPCLPYGHFFIPPVGAKVWVEFEAGDTTYPLWVGAWYPNDQTPTVAAITPPENRVIQTPSGHTIEIMDKQGEEKILIKHKSNAFVSIDKNGSVLVSNANGSHLFLNADGKEATLMHEDGHLLTMTSAGAVMVNKDGSTLELKGDAATVLAKNISLSGTSVALGSGAQNPTIEAKPSFIAMFTAFMTAHVHATALGPSGPPTPPGPTLAPGSNLTSSVLVK